MVGYSELIDSILQHLRDGEDYLKIPRERIAEGQTGTKPMKAPFLLVFGVPRVAQLTANARVMAAQLDIAILIGVDKSKDQAKAVRRAMAAAARVQVRMGLMSGIGFTENPISFVGDTSDSFLVELDCVSWYDPLKVPEGEEI